MTTIFPLVELSHSSLAASHLVNTHPGKAIAKGGATIKLGAKDPPATAFNDRRDVFISVMCSGHSILGNSDS